MGVLTGMPTNGEGPALMLEEIEEPVTEEEKLRREGKRDGQLVYDATGAFTHALAPNGEVSNLNEELWLLVRTERFRGWFGDWQGDPENASKVVDENGEPLVLVRGTDEDMTVPDTNRKLTEAFGDLPVGTEYNGLFFSDNSHYSSVSGGSNLYRVFLNIRNPMRFDELSTPVVVNAQKDPNFTRFDGFIGAEAGVFNVKNSKPIPVMAYVVFEPEQIKSIDAKDFSVKSKNIYE